MKSKKGSIYELINRIIVVNSIVSIIGFLFKKSKKFIKKIPKTEQYESSTDPNLDVFDIYFTS